MSIDRLFNRLSLRSQSICRQCRRGVASSTTTRQQSATGAFADLLQSSRTSTGSPLPRQAPANTTPAPPLTSHELAQRTVRLATANRKQMEEQRMAQIQKSARRQDLEQQAVRRWRAGDVYAPHDLSGVEQSKWRKLQRRPRQKLDVMDQLGINPLHHYKNFSMMAEYMTEMGRIKHSRDTGLRPVNQRRMAKAIRRAIGMGLIPGVHRHPEILKRQSTMGASLR